jgi:demethylmenaquinone methyltransferase/2-methoxy-6-polyprenyl-1,4-benzoquinol methylase
MFAGIAGRYDLMNRLMTFGRDGAWRREVVRRAEMKPGARLLDLGAGTGELARLARRYIPGVRVIAADFTAEMIRAGRKRRGGEGIAWVAADALHLPFAGTSCDGVVSGYLLRNVSDLSRVLAEERRVLRPGGRAVSLDTTPPPRSAWRPLVQFHLRTLIPLLGRLITGSSVAYRYLPDSTEAFLGAEEVAGCMEQAGFREVGFQRRWVGTMAIHWGRR